MNVTCESPPSLRGRPVWNVSVCVTSPPPPPPSPSPSVTQTVHPKPTTVPASTSAKVLTTPPSRPTSKPSVQPKPSDAPVTMSSNPAAHVTSPPSVTEITVQPKPSDLPRTKPTPTGMTETCETSRPSSDTNIVCTLVVVIAVLSLLLSAACFLTVLHRRNRISKTVMPVRPEENRNQLKEDSGSSRAQSPGHSEKRENNHRDSETGWRTSFTGVRAKSANAILFMSPFCAPVKDGVTLQTETQSKDAENQAEGKQNLEDETEADGGVETDDAKVIQHAKQSKDGVNLDEISHHVSVNADTAPYLSIGTNQTKPNPDDFNKQPTDGSGQRSQKGKVMGRISTWPPTAVQWQARCKAKEDEEESDVFTVWSPTFSGEVEKVLKAEEPPSGSDWDKREEDIETSRMEDLGTAPNQDPLKMTEAPMTLGLSQSSKPNDKTTCFSEAPTHTDTRLEEQLKEEEMIQDPATVRQTQNLNQDELGPNQGRKSAENPAQKKSSNKASASKRAGTSRQRAENRSTGPKAPSGGASPDDETLLSGNEYAFMDLLHEVVQNNGRWTRDRWKQINVNKQRRPDRGTEGV
ncbi:uncharacterized protein LOC129101656 [Anoplopoma fimbria]|uniref:uncharacterized protein LOC129101656 n=1 Tax=Anoplopoma fimbria TaxID=229290 RepID=UPI0023ED0966|nr:uncharacterized protein LOC129101656 [Anoplopoma fimbria]